jgi:hypothetical protein
MRGCPGPISWASRVPISPLTERGFALASVARAALLAGALLASAGSAAQPHQKLADATDLARDGQVAAQRGVPIVILFSLPGCSYCEVVRRNYLLPLAHTGAAHLRPLVREVDMASVAPLRGFGQQASSGKILAHEYGVRVAPTVIVLDGRGKRLAPPLAGGDVAGMYGAYLDAALAAGRSALDTSPDAPQRKSP